MTLNDRGGFPGVPFAIVGIDPRAVLATGMHSAPGVYAMLIGSGMSSAAGIKTGWQITQDLIRKIALTEDVDLAALGQTPEEWWAREDRGEPRYDTLLPALASTDAARQALLREYFDPPPDLGNPILPTAGHHALAQLCARGSVRVILTTNFDRLIERALEQAGVGPQVVTSSEQAKGMTPLVHAPVTVVKLHGDYSVLSNGLRNTREELGSYPAGWTTLLQQVFDEFGLVVVGWSADYDTALYKAIADCPSRRYPTFWASYRGSLTEPATRLIDQRRAAVIDISGADEFLSDAVERLDRLDQVSQRQSRPIRVEYRHSPATLPVQGWSESPLLSLRVVALVGPAFVGQYDDIGPEQREKLVADLRTVALTNRLRALAGAKPVYARDLRSAETFLLGDWGPTPGHQSGTHACYSIGTDGSSAVSGQTRIELPNHHTGGSALVTIDVGLSLEQPLHLFELAGILRDGLVATSGALADAIVDILPIEADVTGVELHLQAPKRDGSGSSRDNCIEQRVNFDQLGQQTRALPESFGVGLQLSGALVERDAAEIVVSTVKHWALASGYLDPRIGLTQLATQLGLAATST